MRVSAIPAQRGSFPPASRRANWQVSGTDAISRHPHAYADGNTIPWVKFDKDDDKLAVMGPHIRRQAATGQSGVAAIGVSQEFQRVWTAVEGKTSTGTPPSSFYKADRRVTVYYYLWDDDFGPAFIKLCTLSVPKIG